MGVGYIGILRGSQSMVREEAIESLDEYHNLDPGRCRIYKPEDG